MEVDEHTHRYPDYVVSTHDQSVWAISRRANWNKEAVLGSRHTRLVM